ncbi:MAG: hypothetical protein BM556_02480 [Bacteriovorax sp. MedPE-SWde]|nr:MAG: hypothetical protein BM556_02480 [Bacteriovorax sp. MedPE-SWde]
MDITFNSKIGIIKVSGCSSYIRKVDFLEGSQVQDSSENINVPSPLYTDAKNQIQEYLSGQRSSFDLALNFESGTEFQQSVWKEMLKIPYGEVRTYGEIAKLLGKPGASRAIGGACNKNPIPLIIPCHRIVSSTGLGGFAYGLTMKNEVLNIESSK